MVGEIMARQKSQCWHSENPGISRDQWSMTQRLTTDLLFGEKTLIWRHQVFWNRLSYHHLSVRQPPKLRSHLSSDQEPEIYNLPSSA